MNDDDKRHKIIIYIIAIIIFIVVLIYIGYMIVMDNMFEFIFPKQFHIECPELIPIKIQ